MCSYKPGKATDKSRDIIARFDRNHRHLYVSPAILHVTGIRAGEFIGKSSSEMGMPKYLCEVWAGLLDQVFGSGDEVSGEFEFPSLEGPRVYDVRMAPEFAEDGTVAAVVSFIREASEQQDNVEAVHEMSDRALADSLEQLRLSQEQFRIMGETVDFGVWMADADGYITYISPSFLRLLGTTLEDVKEVGWIPRMALEDVPATLAHWVHCIRTGEDWDCELRFPANNGVMYTILSRGKSLRDSEGRVAAWAGINLDITERKRALEDLLRLRRESEHISRVNVMGEFASTLAHELNQMLAAILSNAQAALRYLDADQPDLVEVKHILQDIVSEDKRAGTIIRNMRAIVHRGESECEQLQINEIVREVVTLLNSEFISSGLTLELDLHPRLPLVCACRVEMQQVLLNLTVNALDAMKGVPVARRRLEFSTTPKSDGVVVSVRDSGVGILEEDTETIFQPLFTTKNEGLGMGLAICKRIVEACDGRLWAENNKNGGATFSLFLSSNHTRSIEGK